MSAPSAPAPDEKPEEQEPVDDHAEIPIPPLEQPEKEQDDG